MTYYPEQETWNKALGTSNIAMKDDVFGRLRP